MFDNKHHITPNNYCINRVKVAYEKEKKKSINDMIKSQKEGKQKLELLLEARIIMNCIWRHHTC